MAPESKDPTSTWRTAELRNGKGPFSDETELLDPAMPEDSL